jgi:hypothetical protein
MGADLVSEQELDDVLAQASALASDLSDEVGAIGRDGSDPEPAPQTQQPTGTGAPGVDLDTELRELEKLVSETGDQLGPDSADSDQARAPFAQDDPGPQTPPNALDVPDFMAELTEPDRAADAGQPENAPPTTTDQSESLADDPAAPQEAAQTPHAEGQLTGEAQSPAFQDHSAHDPHAKDNAHFDGSDLTAARDTEPETDSQRQSDTPPEDPTPPQPGRFEELARRATARLSPLAATTCDHIVTALEVVDRPFARVGNRIRYLAGWIAIATVGTSLVVYFLSLF